MDLLQLRYFQTVARAEHVSRAAADLGVAQPSVSRTIARLESELGVPLFDRTGRKVALNRFGALFLRRVDRALAELDDARAELADASGLERGTVAVAAESPRSYGPVLTRFLAAHPDVNFRLYQASAPEMAELLAAGRIDLALVSQPLREPGLAERVLTTERVLLAVPPGHPLVARGVVGVADLAGLPLVTNRPGFWLRQLLDALCAEAGVEPVISCETDEPVSIRDLISLGLGVGLLPEVTRRRSSHPPVDWVELDSAAACRTLRLVWRADAYLSVAARAFCDTVIALLAA